MQEYFRRDKIVLYNNNILESNFEQNTIDLVITSPPYNLDIQYDNYKDKLNPLDYFEFTEYYLELLYGWLRDDGRLCLNLPLDTTRPTNMSLYATITNLAIEIGFKYQSTIIWHKPAVNFKTAWGSFQSASAPHVICPDELILVMCKNTWKKTSGSRINDIKKDEFIQWSTGFWTINTGSISRNKNHPVAFPLELPTRLMKMFSYVDDTVIDPFCGSGTTLVACSNNNRKGIGVEISSEYCEIIKKRLDFII